MNSNIRLPMIYSVSGRAVSAFSAIAIMPVLSYLLGTEGIGLVGFFTSLLMVFMVLEGGLTSFVTRKLAQLRVGVGCQDPPLAVSEIFKVYLLQFIVVGLICGFVISFSAHFLAEKWLTLNSISLDQGVAAIKWMGLAIALNLPILLLHACFVGVENLITQNKLLIMFSSCKTFGVALILYLYPVARDIDVYFQIYATVQALHLLFLFYWFVSLHCKHFARAQLRFGLLSEGVRFSLGVFLISISSAFILQFDKIYLTGVLSVAEFAPYSIAAAVAAAPYVISSALQSVIYPLFSKMVATGIDDLFYRTFERITLLMLLAMSAIYYLSLFFAEHVFNLVFESSLAESIYSVFILLVAGSVLQAALVVMYCFQLAVGWVRLPLTINLILMPFILFLVPILFGTFGVTGAASVWVGYNLFAFLLTFTFAMSRYPRLRSLFFSTIRFLLYFLLVTGATLALVRGLEFKGLGILGSVFVPVLVFLIYTYSMYMICVPRSPIVDRVI